MTDQSGNIQERIAYTPYGVASQRLHKDINNDGVVDGGDIGFITNNWGATIGLQGYNPDADLNDDGTINGSDIGPITNNYNATGALPGQLSAFGNTVGYSGYLYDDAINLSLARFRWYDADTGRWATRDPSQFHDGMSLYQYVQSNPITSIDPYGLGEICRRPLKPRTIEIDLYPWWLRAFGVGGGIIKIKANPMLPWDNGPLLDPLNYEPEHEHIFFDDGLDPPDAGFFPDGIRRDINNPRSVYTDCESYSNDRAIREALARFKRQQPFCLGGAGYNLLRSGGENCQGLTACVRKEYTKLTNRRTECARWVFRHIPGTAILVRVCAERRTVEDPWPCK